MSADRQRLKNAIQRIAKEDPGIRSLLGGGQNKGGKASSAGVGVSDAERDRICCDGSTSGSANPGTEEREVGDSQSGLDSSDPADIGGGDGTLDGVTDCATGAPICFDGSGFVPPDGWDDPNEPPVSTEYAEGEYWKVQTWLGTYYYQTEGEARAKLRETCETLQAEPTCGNLACSNANLTSYSCGSDSGSMTLQLCDSTYNIICDEPPPTDDMWPSDGCTNLAIVNGKIVGSKYDTENDGTYSAPRDSIDLCDSEGNQISLAPSADGGWKTINSTTDNGYLYDSSGRQIAHIDGNEYADPSM